MNKTISLQRLSVMVFVTGACVMMLEVTASRVLAPYFGTSTIVWTSLIGLILASLSVGYYWGGKIADSKPDIAYMSSLIVWAAIGISLIAITKNSVTATVSSAITDIRFGVVLVVLILFCPPSVILGMASPFAARLALDSTKHTGEIIGRLYALSTFGSIVGTFLAGFVLLGVIGHTSVLLLIAVILVGVSMIGFSQHWTKKRVALCAAAIVMIVIGTLHHFFAPLAPSLLLDKDTTYQRIQVRDAIERFSGRPARFLQTDSFGVQSAQFTDTNNPEDLVFPYTKRYRLIDHFVEKPEKVLMIGGAAYSVPRDIMARHQDLYMDVVELDSGMTTVARDFFGLEESDRLDIYHTDGRLFLSQADTALYDAIFVDAFNSVLIPFQLTTIEAAQEMYRILEDDGVVIINLISSIEGSGGKMVQAEVTTFQKVFPHVSIYPVTAVRDGATVQNVMLIASKKENPSFTNSDPELQSYLDTKWKKPIEEGDLLTDDYAPVESYIFGLLR